MRDFSRRNFVTLFSGLCCSLPLLAQAKSVTVSSVRKAEELSAKERQQHEFFMQKAIAQAARNPAYPFGAIIADLQSGKIFSEGVNNGAENPTFHGEMVAINDYVHKHGNQGWQQMTLYTTGEPCSVCMSAIAQAGIKRVVWASSVQKIRASGIGKIDIPAAEVAFRVREFYQPVALISGVLATQTDNLFDQRTRS
ncbi:nucleoside deaminase [Erwinia mallotivora]|uniref:nucleoside deaminase n=1 Tax=Erwinia mallotivora TaxID=69222 RepID=UPI0035E9E459